MSAPNSAVALTMESARLALPSPTERVLVVGSLMKVSSGKNRKSG